MWIICLKCGRLIMDNLVRYGEHILDNYFENWRDWFSRLFNCEDLRIVANKSWIAFLILANASWIREW